jgi:molybdate transport system ATP-binding protein
VTLRVDIKKRLGKFMLDVKFEAGEGILALLGASGGGKSMTLKCIAGIETPDEGRVELGGRVLFDSEKKINLPTRERKVGYLFQHYALFPNMTALENVMAAAKGSRAEKRAAAEERLELMYLLDSQNKYPGQLSGGQQQRVALARMLVGDPEVIMLDEPLSALDSYLKWQLEMELVDIFRGFDKPVIYVTHNRDEVFRISNEVCVLDFGKNEDVIPTRDMFLTPGTFAAALISGCKNFSYARKTGEYSVFADDWNAELITGAPVPEDIKCIGVRSHAIKAVGAELYPLGENANPNKGKNIITCRIDKLVHEMFSVIVMIHPCEPAHQRDSDVRQSASHDTNFSNIRLKLTNDRWAILGEPPIDSVIKIRIDPKEILLLS